MKRFLLCVMLLGLLVSPANAMLAKYWRLRILWDGDQTLTYADGARVVTRCVPWKIASGNLSYGTTITDSTDYLNTGETLADDGETEGGVNDNTSDLYWGVKGQLAIICDVTSSDGTFYLYIEESDTDGTWPSDAADFAITDLRLVCAMAVSTDAEDEERIKNFEF